jgi:hypothetical protein
MVDVLIFKLGFLLFLASISVACSPGLFGRQVIVQRDHEKLKSYQHEQQVRDVFLKVSEQYGIRQVPVNYHQRSEFGVLLSGEGNFNNIGYDDALAKRFFLNVLESDSQAFLFELRSSRTALEGGFTEPLIQEILQACRTAGITCLVDM